MAANKFFDLTSTLHDEKTTPELLQEKESSIITDITSTTVLHFETNYPSACTCIYDCEVQYHIINSHFFSRTYMCILLTSTN